MMLTTMQRLRTTATAMRSYDCDLSREPLVVVDSEVSRLAQALVGSVTAPGGCTDQNEIEHSIRLGRAQIFGHSLMVL